MRAQPGDGESRGRRLEAGEVTDADPLAAPGLARFADLTVQVAAPIEVGPVGHGTRRVIPILGGICVARDWSARVLAGGADFQLIVNERMARLEARYVLETDAGDRIYVHNDAVRAAAPEVMARLLRGEPVEPADVYFRCAPRFEASAPALAWLMERGFLGTGLRRPSEVVIRFFGGAVASPSWWMHLRHACTSLSSPQSSGDASWQPSVKHSKPSRNSVPSWSSTR